MDHIFFIHDLQKLLKKHKIFLSGKLRISSNKKSQGILFSEVDGDGIVKDTMGPFLYFRKEEFSDESTHKTFKIKTVIVDKDRLLANGVISPIDGKTAFHNRQDWANHLKANDCVEIGNDFNKSHEKRKPIEGDFDCRKELTKVTHQVMEKYGH